MSAQDDVAVLLKAASAGGTVEERVRVLVSKLGQLVGGMKLNVRDPETLTAMDGVVVALFDNSDAIVRAVVGKSEVGMGQPVWPEPDEPESWHDIEDEERGNEPEPEVTEPEPVPRAAAHKSKHPVRRKK